jgi:hypothetical protein
MRKSYEIMISGGAYAEVMQAAGCWDQSEGLPTFPGGIDMPDHHAACRLMPDGTRRYWAYLGSLKSEEICPSNPNIVWFDDPKELVAWLVACARLA